VILCSGTAGGTERPEDQDPGMLRPPHVCLSRRTGHCRWLEHSGAGRADAARAVQSRRCRGEGRARRRALSRRLVCLEAGGLDATWWLL